MTHSGVWWVKVLLFTTVMSLPAMPVKIPKTIVTSVNTSRYLRTLFVCYKVHRGRWLVETKVQTRRDPILTSWFDLPLVDNVTFKTNLLDCDEINELAQQKWLLWTCRHSLSCNASANQNRVQFFLHKSAELTFKVTSTLPHGSSKRWLTL